MTGVARLTRGLAVVAVALSLILAAGCGSHWPRLTMPGKMNSGVAVGIGMLRPNHSADVGSIQVCLTRPGKVTITGVEPIRPVGDIEVQAFAVRPNPLATGADLLGSDRRTLAQSGFDGSHTVDRVCKTNDGSTSFELGLQLTKPTQADVGAPGWTVSYRSGSHTGTLAVPLGITLCSEPSADAPACREVLGDDQG